MKTIFFHICKINLFYSYSDTGKSQIAFISKENHLSNNGVKVVTFELILETRQSEKSRNQKAIDYK